ncbi:MAG: hypothetical protein IPK67_08560 [Planctomycetes bacterium]|nr:hypothetical protein [Planctomycetota bacterium]
MNPPSAEVRGETAGGFSGFRPAGETSLWREPLFWLALTLAATRFLRLGEWSLWEDEVFTLADAREWLEPGSARGPRNPLGYMLFAGLIHGLGPVPGEFGMRFVPALLGVLGIVATGFGFAPLFGARRAAAAAAIVAASSWHLYWSQNARFYTLAQDFALIGGVLAMRAVLAPRGERFLGTALTALAALLLAAMAQPASALLIPAWFGAALLLPRRRLVPVPRPLPISRALWLGAGLVGLALAAWVVPMWLDFARTKRDPTVLHLLATSGWYFTPALLSAALFGVWCAWRGRSAPDLLAGLACTLTAGLALLNACFLRAAAQYLFVLLPFVAVLATAPLGDRRTSGRWRWGWLAALLLPALCDQALYFAVRHGDRPPWREGFAAVHERSQPGDLVFTNNANVGEYYLAPRSDSLRHPVHVHNLDRYSYLAEQHWARQGRRTWFVLNLERLGEWPREAEADLRRMLASEARLVAAFPVDVGVRDLDVLVYLRE